MRKAAVVVDQGPPELRYHNKVVVEQDARFRVRLRVVDQLVFDGLLHERKITLDEHTSCEHLHRDLVAAGFIRSSNWTLDNSIKSDLQSISSKRSDALVKIGMARRWLHERIGRKATDWLVGVCLDAIKVQDRQIPQLKRALGVYREYETAWNNYDGPGDLPALLENVKPVRAPRLVLPVGAAGA